MSRSLLRSGLLVMLATAVSGCSYIKSFFPDKERDYQFRTEFPALIIPDDLKNSGLAAKTTPVAAPAATKRPDMPAAAAVDKVDSAKPAVAATAPTVSVTHAAVSSLQIDQALNPAWRMVGKALSRNQLEITERNQDKAYYYIKYDPAGTKPIYRSLWDEVGFLFDGDPSTEQEYRIVLQALNTQTTEVTVQNNAGTPLSDVIATQLLKLITDGINQDLSKESSDKAATP